MKSNKEFKVGQVLEVSFGEDLPLVECAFKEPVAGGYSRCIVIDIDRDRVVEGSANGIWSKQLVRNHARGAEYEINIKQIMNVQ
jgi:hypothetical protein